MLTVLRAVSQSLDARGGRTIVMGVDDAQPLDPVSAVLVLQLASAGYAFVIATVRSSRPAGDSHMRGPTGFGLYRAAVAAGIEMQVLAPGKTPRASADRVKTDRKGSGAI
jgi:hypothetical protein